MIILATFLNTFFFLKKEYSEIHFEKYSKSGITFTLDLEFTCALEMIAYSDLRLVKSA